MTPTNQARALVLSRIRAALGVTGKDRKREDAVEDRLRNHPRGTIPARARADHEALLELMTTMLAKPRRRGHAGKRRRRRPCARSPPISAPMIFPRPSAWEAIRCSRRSPGNCAEPCSGEFGRAGPHDRAALSRAVAAAAETGTLVLVSGADNPTTLAFLPETHFILVRAGDVVGCLRGGLRSLARDLRRGQVAAQRQFDQRAVAHRRYRADHRARRARAETAACGDPRLGGNRGGHFFADFLLLWKLVACFRSPEASAMVQRTLI